MSISPNSPNNQADVNAYSQFAETAVGSTFGRLGTLTVKDVLGFTILEQSTGFNSGIVLSELINELDMPILKNLALDCIAVVSNWFNDPELLCCLIQGIWAIYAASHSNTDLAKLQQNGTGVADSSFGKFLDILIAFVDLIISFISSDIKKISTMIPDFIKEIANGVIGAILMVMQEVLFALRDSIINYILQQIDRAQALSLDMENIWAKCIPFGELLDILKKHVHDYGLFAELFEKIKGFVAGKVGDFAYMKKLDFPKNIKDIEFLYWFRDLLIKLKQAAISFDLCVNYGTGATGGAVPTPVPPGDEEERIGLPKNTTGRTTPNEVQGIKVAADGTILQDRPTERTNLIPVLANSSIRNFLHKYYGYPLDVIDNLITGSTSLDSIKGTDINSANVSNLNADCPNSPTPAQIVRWALEIRSRNL